MIYRNKNFLTFFSLAVFLSAIVLTASQRLYPLFQHSVYYCQTVIRSLFFHIPYQINIIALFVVSVLVFATGLKFFNVFLQTRLLRKKLLPQIEPSTRLRTILKKLGLDRKTYMVKSDKPFAFCFGIRSPKIYLSTTTVAMLEKKELEAVLLHEQYHIDHRDTLIMFVASLCQSLFPFFPLVSDLLHNYRVEREIKADQHAIDYLGSSKPIVSVLKKLLLQPSGTLSVVPAIGDHDTLEPRINALIKHDSRFKTFQGVNVFFSLLSVCILLVIALSPAHAVEIHTEEQDYMVVCPSGKECIASCEEQMTSNGKIPQVKASYPLTPTQ